MSAAFVVAIVASLTAILALLFSIRARRLLRVTRVELASASAALAQERHATATAMSALHRSMVEEVATLLENALAQVDTDITAKVAEALALQHHHAGLDQSGADQQVTGT